MKKYIIIIFVFFHLNSPRLKSYLSPLRFYYAKVRNFADIRKFQSIYFIDIQRVNIFLRFDYLDYAKRQETKSKAQLIGLNIN